MPLPAVVEIEATSRHGNLVWLLPLQVIIAGAGGAAHLPGMVAALTPLPVIGVPVKPTGAHLDGLDALLSIVQVCVLRFSSISRSEHACNPDKNIVCCSARIVLT